MDAVDILKHEQADVARSKARTNNSAELILLANARVQQVSGALIIPVTSSEFCFSILQVQSQTSLLCYAW